MSCSNSAASTNNSLLPASDADATTLTLAFGAYKNWGNWNHNTQRIQHLADILIDQGYSVQLQHNDEEEKGDGWVAVLLNDNELARLEDVQHNKNSANREAMLEEMGNNVLEEIKKVKAD